jgi:hypothetical protein
VNTAPSRQEPRAVLEKTMHRINSHLASLEFRLAAEMWYQHHKPYWKQSTAETYRKYIRRLNRLFANLTLGRIHIHHFREYQKINSALREDGRPRYVASSINHDLDTLMQILSQAGLAEGIKPLYRQLPVPVWTPPRVLSEAEEHRFFEIAASDTNLSIAYWVSSLTNNTAASASELRKVQLKHVHLDSSPPLLYIPSDKVRNEHRARVIPLNERGLTEVKRIIQRAQSLGCSRPEDYLLPLRLSDGRYDPSRPASAWFIYKQWKKLVDAAIAKGAINFRIKPFQMRYNVVAKLLKARAPESTVKSIAGHVRREMLEHFSRRRLEEKARALNMISYVSKIDQ